MFITAYVCILQHTPVSLWTFIIVKDVNFSVFIVLRSHVRCFLIAEKLLSHLQEATGSVHEIFRSTKIFGKWSFSHSLIAVASVDPRCDFRFWNIFPLFHLQGNFLVNNVGLIKSALNISMAGASFVTLSNSLHVNSGTRYRTLDAVIENLLKRNFISEIKVSNTGIAMARF